MEVVVSTFGLVAVEVVVTDSKFRSGFKEICRRLKLTFWSLARGYYKGLSVQRKMGQ